MMINQLRGGAMVLALVLLVASCTDSDEGASDDGDGGLVVDTSDLSADERCTANEEAGTITFVSSFDFAAAASILDVVVADAEGYFDEACLDVDIKPGFAPGNGGLVAEGQAQISSAGSFGEMVNTNVQGEADLVAIAQYGKTAIEALVVPADGSVVELEDLAGTTVGIKGDLPYSLQAMLGLAGVERSSFEEFLLDGFDPVAHFDPSLGIDALPVYKSNEPAQLDAAGFDYRQFDPLDFDVPASFAVFFTSASFLEEHPTAVEDFLRAAFRGFAFAVENPEVAVGHAFDRIDAAGNPAFLSTDGEGFRWVTESTLVLDTTPPGAGPGLLDLDRLGDEIELLTEVGVFDEAPDWRSMVAEGLADRLYDGTDVEAVGG
ncbi:MAG: ABC transporter substrate-binding protein [Actinomycetia bacterium]|nr:ABC transporter substrate-binding protein [Actinomycetes bacterium]